MRARAPVPAVAATRGSLLLRIQRLLAASKSGAPLHPWRLAGSLAAATLILVLGAARQAHATGARHAEPRPFEQGMAPQVLLSGDDPQLPKSMLPHPGSTGRVPEQSRDGCAVHD